MGESKEYEVESAFSEDFTSEIQDPSSISHLRAPKNKSGKWTLSYQEEMISLENRKLEWLIKQDQENYEDQNFLRSQFQNMVADDITALQNNLHNFQPQALTVFMAVGLQNCACTCVMARIISLTNILQLFLYEFATVRTTDIRYSLIHVTANVNRDNVFTSILPSGIPKGGLEGLGG
jgi:sulfite reductase beta subunit-like hemoprotein